MRHVLSVLTVLGLLVACGAPESEPVASPSAGGQGLPTVMVFHSPT